MVTFDYFYGQEAEQFTFFRIPKLLITEPEFSSLSDSAKIMYGLLLDRTCLSQSNDWLDDNNRAYVIFTNEDIQEQLNCSKNTVTKILAELDTKKGIGLIERIRRGLGKPDIIYVKNFTTIVKKDDDATQKDPETPEITDYFQNPKYWETRIPKSGNQQSQSLGFNNPEDWDSAVPKSGSAIMNNTDLNNTDLRETKKSKTPLARASLPYPRKNERKEEVLPDDDPLMTEVVKKRVQWLTQDQDAIDLTPREKEMFDLFIAERKKRGKSTSRVQRNMLIQQLYLLGTDEPTRIEILEKTIGKGWNDLYPLDKDNGSP